MHPRTCRCLLAGARRRHSYGQYRRIDLLYVLILTRELCPEMLHFASQIIDTW